MIDATRYSCLGLFLEDALQTYKSRTALIEVKRHRETARLSYLDLRNAVRAVASFFEPRVPAEGRIAIVGENQHRWLVAAAATLRGGRTLVPLDARLTADELHTLLCHSGAALACMDRSIFTKRTDWPCPVVLLEGEATGADPFEEALATPPTATPQRRTRGDIACIVYSSGTGGSPKGCLLSHGAYLSQYTALSHVFSWHEDDRYLSILPTNHAIDFMCGFLAPLGCGAAVVQLRTVRPAYLLDTLRTYSITQMAVVPLILDALHRAIQEKTDALPEGRQLAFRAIKAVHGRLTEDAPWPTLSRWMLKPLHDVLGGRLKTLFCGGAFTPRAPTEALYELGIPVAIGYGLTEACTVATVNDLKPFRADSVGAPLPGIQVRIDRPDSHGIGEVWLKGPTLFSGYLDDAERTSESLVDGWLRTGDLGWQDAAGHLHLVGRARNMIVTPGGKNVYPEDVEQFFGDLPGEDFVLFATDFLYPRDELPGEALTAVLFLGPDATPDTALDALRQANRRLPEHKRARTALFCTEAFPRTTSLKVKRMALADHLAQTTHRDDLVEL